MTKDALNPDLIEIELLARKFSDEHNKLSGLAEDLETDIRDLKLRRLTRIRTVAGRTVAARSALIKKISTHPELFKKPKTREFFGIRLGYMKRKGSITFKDADVLVARIRKRFPDQADSLIATKETPIKSALQNLSGAILKSLGVRVEDDADEPFVKLRDGDVLKQVNAWLESDNAKEGS